MNDFTIAVTLILIGVLAGAVPQFISEQLKWRRQTISNHSADTRKVLSELLKASRDIRNRTSAISQSMRGIDEAPTPRDSQLKSLAEARDQFEYAYQELSLLVDQATYIRMRALAEASETLQQLVFSGASTTDSDLLDAHETMRARRRELRDHVRSMAGLDDLGGHGHIGGDRSKDLPGVGG